MKDRKQLFIAIMPVLAVAGLFIILAGRKRKINDFRKKEQIADEGYETAADILFPLKNQSARYKINVMM